MELLAIFLDTVGYKHWHIQGTNFTIHGHVLSIGYGQFKASQKAYASKPFVAFSVYDRCEELQLRVQLSSGEERKVFYSKDTTAWRKVVLEMDAQDTVELKMTLRTYARTFCKVHIRFDSSNFLRNLDFSEYALFPKGWAYRNAEYEDGKVYVREGYIRREIALQKGRVFRLSYEGEGSVEWHIGYGTFKKRRKGRIIYDTVSALWDTLSIKLKCKYCSVRSVRLDTLSLLKVHATKLKRNIFIHSYLNGLRFYIYDSDGKLYRKGRLSKGINLVRMDRAGKFLLVVPKFFKSTFFVR